jgi:hypothetical protein
MVLINNRDNNSQWVMDLRKSSIHPVLFKKK